MKERRYGGYRGRLGSGDILRVVVGVLAALVVLVLVILLLGQRYIYYTADGVRLELPFLRDEPTEPPDLSQVVVEVIPPAPQEPDRSEPEADVSGEEATVPDGSGPVDTPQQGQPNDSDEPA